MKQTNLIETYFKIVKFITDCLLIPIIIITAYSLKFKVGWVFQNIFYLPYGRVYTHAQIEPYLQVAWLIIALWVITFFFTGMYRSFRGFMAEVDEFASVFKGVSIAAVEVMLAAFILELFPGSRFVIVYMWIIGIVLLFFTRFIYHHFELKLLKKGIGSKPALIIGADPIGQDIAEKMIVMPRLGLRYTGTLEDQPPEKLHFHLKERFRYFGGPENYKQVCEKETICVIYVTKTDLSTDFYEDLLLFCEDNGIELKIFSELSLFSYGAASLDTLDGVLFISHQHLPDSMPGYMLKRIFDVLVSLTLMILFLPVFLIAALIIKIVSPSGPVFYVQERIGRNDKPFGMIKYRTMVPEAEKATGPVMVDQETDQRIIKFGNFLRKMSIDELPQLLNVLKGDMSLVGPRPERPYFVAQFNKNIPYFHLRHKVRGGITGWAQVNGRSVLTSRPEHKIKYDLYYIQNWSLTLDLKILIKTLSVVLRKEEAY
ncbi:sugar transferase [Thermoproteota archaeon]